MGDKVGRSGNEPKGTLTEEGIEPVKVSFQGQELMTARINDVVYVAMKPVVEGMGLDWRTQQRKIASDPRYGHMTIPFYRPENTGQNFNLVCLPVDQLNGWLNSINANKVRPEIREKVLAYQKECMAAINDYWTKGQATNPRMQAPKRETEISRRHIPNRMEMGMGQNPPALKKIYKTIRIFIDSHYQRNEHTRGCCVFADEVWESFQEFCHDFRCYCVNRPFFEAILAHDLGIHIDAPSGPKGDYFYTNIACRIA